MSVCVSVNLFCATNQELNASDLVSSRSVNENHYLYAYFVQLIRSRMHVSQFVLCLHMKVVLPNTKNLLFLYDSPCTLLVCSTLLNFKSRAKTKQNSQRILIGYDRQLPFPFPNFVSLALALLYIFSTIKAKEQYTRFWSSQ